MTPEEREERDRVISASKESLISKEKRLTESKDKKLTFLCNPPTGAEDSLGEVQSGHGNIVLYPMSGCMLWN